jgi:uncharacterized protein DUF5362
MEDQNTSLFGLTIDTDSKSHLAESARWAKFLAIVGFVVCGLVVLIGIFAGSIIASFTNLNRDFGDSAADTSGLGVVLAIMYIGFAVLYFFPCLFLFRHANYMKNALATNNQETLNKSFQNLKVMFRYVGILTIIVLSIYLLIFMIGLLTIATRA